MFTRQQSKISTLRPLYWQVRWASKTIFFKFLSCKCTNLDLFWSSFRKSNVDLLWIQCLLRIKFRLNFEVRVDGGVLTVTICAWSCCTVVLAPETRFNIRYVPSINQTWIFGDWNNKCKSSNSPKPSSRCYYRKLWKFKRFYPIL